MQVKVNTFFFKIAYFLNKMHISGYPKRCNSKKIISKNDFLGNSKFYKRLILAQYILIKEGLYCVTPYIEQIGGANGLFSGHNNE